MANLRPFVGKWTGFYTDQREFGSHRSMSTLAARKFVALYRYGTNKEKAPWGQSAFGGKSARRGS